MRLNGTIVELRIVQNPEGYRSLEQRAASAAEGWLQADPVALLANLNEPQFYRAVADWIAKLSKEGKCVRLADHSKRPAG